MTLTYRPVLLLDDDVFLEHAAPEEHPERPARLTAVREGLTLAARELELEYTRLSFGDADDTQLGRVHDASYIERIGLLAGRSGMLDEDTYLSPASVAAARRAAGSGVALVQALTRGAAPVGMALPRPPGHHALADRAMGFCLFNNVAVAAAEARQLGHQRVLILDWDVHHGNGTETMFYDDPSVLFVSLHQAPGYPGTGAVADVGRGDGRGRSVNLPLPPGASDATYEAAFERVVLPIVSEFAPTLALVSCGFDAHERDPLAELQLTARAFSGMTRSLLQTLPEGCPLGLMLEGGYDLTALRDSSAEVARALFGQRPEAPEARAERGPFSDGPARSLSPAREEEDVLRQVLQTQQQYWRFG